jgi:hypothetical protein
VLIPGTNVEFVWTDLRQEAFANWAFGAGMALLIACMITNIAWMLWAGLGLAVVSKALSSARYNRLRQALYAEHRRGQQDTPPTN